jgi:hypothetical protein
MKPLRNNTTGYLGAALAVAAFLMASQTAGASVIPVLFTVSPIDTLMAQGVPGAFEVDLTNTGSVPEQIGAFRFGLTTNLPGITFVSVTTATLAAPYIFAGATVGSWHGPIIATALNPAVAVMDQANSNPMMLAAGATVGLGYVTYRVDSNATLGSVINIGFAAPAGDWEAARLASANT